MPSAPALLAIVFSFPLGDYDPYSRYVRPLNFNPEACKTLTYEDHLPGDGIPFPIIWRWLYKEAVVLYEATFNPFVAGFVIEFYRDFSFYARTFSDLNATY